MKANAVVVIAVVIVVAALANLHCRRLQKEVALRTFPYPNRAALAICSDLDYTDSIEKFLAIQEFLCSTRETPLGPGLGLETGNTFWFYNQFAGGGFLESGSQKLPYSVEGDWFDRSHGISLFAGASDTLNRYAAVMIQLMKAGYIDCLHSYGDFASGGFRRDLAQKAVEFLKEQDIVIQTFVNHGDSENQNNMGAAPSFHGDNPESESYHSDLTTQAGVRYLWRGQMTHCLGQNGRFSPVDWLKARYEWLTDLGYADQDYPHDNQLVHPYRLDDGRMVFEFVRYINPWGKYSIAHQEYITHQLGPEEIDQLIDNQGYLIFYTHLGTGGYPPYLSPTTVDALRYIADRKERGDLFVTTTTRILNYWVNHRHLHWHHSDDEDTIRIVIDSIANGVDSSYVPGVEDLCGFTFYVPNGRPVEVTVAGRPVDIVHNDLDETGRCSVSIPWVALTYPPIAITDQ